MSGDGFIESFATLDTGGDVADHGAKVFLLLRVALFVERGECLDERNARLDHGGELAGEEHEVGLLDREHLVFLAGNRSLLRE